MLSNLTPLVPHQGYMHTCRLSFTAPQTSFAMEAEFGMASPGSSDQAAKEVRHSYANTRTTHWRCVRASRVAWKPEVLRSSARELACACARLRLAAMSCKPCLAEVLICVTGPHTPCASCPPLPSRDSCNLEASCHAPRSVRACASRVLVGAALHR